MGAFDAGIGARGAKARQRWEALFADYRKQFPELAAEIDQMQRRELPKHGTATCRASSRIPRASQAAMLPAKS
jgi:transketolase